MKIVNPNPNIPVDIKVTYQPNWNPLYILLKEFFYDKYEEAANGFMFMGKSVLWDGCEVFNYKHGITRKSISLLPTGTPIKHVSELKWIDIVGKKILVEYIYSIEEISLGESYKMIYESIHQSFGTNKEIPEFTSYSKAYIESRNKMLKDMGYNIVDISTTDNIEQIEIKLNL